jgi:cadmium resistance protein CadD (predicted permease)
MNLALVGQAALAFVATNVDDLVVLAVFFGLAVGRADAGGARARAVGAVWIGQYLGFAGILAASVLGALGAGLLPHGVVAYLGFIPIVLGLRLVVIAWRRSRSRSRSRARVRRAPGGPAVPMHDPVDDEFDEEERTLVRRIGPGGPAVASVAFVTLAGGGDNVSLYVPLFASAGSGGTAVCIAVFLPLVAVWCAVTMLLATRPPVTRAIVRWGTLVLPVVLVGIGVRILLAGGALGL